MSFLDTEWNVSRLGLESNANFTRVIDVLDISSIGNVLEKSFKNYRGNDLTLSSVQSNYDGYLVLPGSKTGNYLGDTGSKVMEKKSGPQIGRAHV